MNAALKEMLEEQKKLETSELELSEFRLAANDSALTALAVVEEVEGVLNKAVELYVAKHPNTEAVRTYHKLKAKGQVLNDKVCGYNRSYPCVSIINAFMTWNQSLDPALYKAFDSSLITAFFFSNFEKLFIDITDGISFKTLPLKFRVNLLRYAKLSTSEARWIACREAYGKLKANAEARKNASERLKQTLYGEQPSGVTWDESEDEEVPLPSAN